MAKGVNKRITIFMDGKEVENSAKAMEAALKKSINEIKNMEIGTKEYIEKAKQIKQIKEIIAEHNDELRKTTGFFDKIKQKGTELQGMFQSAFFIKKAASWAKGMMQEYVDAYKTLDDTLTYVQKTTGLTRAEVEGINEELKKVDTRTPVEQLNKLAAASGDLGYTTRNEILQFVGAADKINQVLGKSLGEEGITQITKLTQVFGTDKTKGVQGATLATASALSELDKQTSASAPAILEFTTRLSAVGKEAGLTQAEIMGLGATLNAQFQDGGASATAVTKALTKMFQDPAKFAKAAGMEVKQFAELIKTDANGALMQLFDNINKKGGLESLTSMFNELGIGGTRGIQIFTTLAGSIDEVRKNQELANKAYADGSSILNDFNEINNNSAAAYEKAKNKIIEAKQELGEKLMPLMIKLTELTAGSTKAISNNIDTIYTLGAAFGVLFLWKSKNLVIDKAIATAQKVWLSLQFLRSKAKRQSIADEKSEAAAIAHNTAVTEQNKLAKLQQQLAKASGVKAAKLQVAVTAQDTAVTIANTAATNANAAAQRALNVAKAATPWGAILTAVTAIGFAVYKWATNQTTVNKALKEFHKESAKSKVEVEELFRELKNLEKGTDAYNTVQQKIIDTYPDILKNQVDEHGNLKDIEKAYNDVTDAIDVNIAKRLELEAIEKIVEKSIKKTQKLLGKFPEEYRATIARLEKEGLNANQILEELGKEFEGNFEKYFVKKSKQFGDMTFLHPMYKDLEAFVDYMESVNKKKEEVRTGFAPLTQTKNTTGEDNSAELEAQKALSAAKKALREKTEKEWQKFQDKLTKLAEDRRKSQLIGFEKERDQITSQYDALIKEAEKFGKRGKEITKRLEDEKWQTARI